MPSYRRQMSPRKSRRFQVRFRHRDEKDYRLGFTTNISETGMFVSTVRPLAPGTELDLLLQAAEERYELRGVAVHAMKVPLSLQYVRPSGMGIRFEEGGDLAAVQALVRTA